LMKALTPLSDWATTWSRSLRKVAS